MDTLDATQPGLAVLPDAPAPAAGGRGASAPGVLVGGRYRLERPLGGGAMGTVWRAHDTRLGRDVAVKEVVPPPALPEPERQVLRERTFREARTAARLAHPSAVTVYDVVEEAGRPCVVMELVEAPTLAEVVRDRGPLPPAEAARVGLAVLGALEAAHSAGVLHRDVKPGNVLLRADGRVVLTDFGIATSSRDERLTSTGVLLGSPAYIAPERARGREPGPPSDLWSLGATLYACVEGCAPFEGDEPLTTLTKVVAEPHRPARWAGPLAPVLDGLLEKDPARRATAAAARAALVRARRAALAAEAGFDVEPPPPAGAARTPTEGGAPGATGPGAPPPREAQPAPPVPTPATPVTRRATAPAPTPAAAPPTAPTPVDEEPGRARAVAGAAAVAVLLALAALVGFLAARGL